MIDENKEYVSSCMYMFNGIPYISGNAYIGMNTAESVIRSKYPGTYTVVRKEGIFGGITIRFDTKQDEMWFRLQHG